jgi:hypothetical protein
MVKIKLRRVPVQIHSYCKTGSFHKEIGEECQDESLSATVGAYDIVVQADGVSSCCHGKRGAQLACEAVVDFIRKEKENVFLYSSRKLAFLLIEHILYFLEIEAYQNGADLADYASTIAFSCVNRENGETVLFSLGDGAIFNSSGHYANAAITPKRYFGVPCLTTTSNAYKYAEIKKLTLSPNDSVLLCTDGLLHAVGISISGSIVFKNAIINKIFSELDNLLSNANEPDDIGYIHYTRTQ